MSRIQVGDVGIHYREVGAGDQTVVFSHSYLCDHRHFDPQIEALGDRFRVLAYDHRGHGQSDKPTSGYGIDQLTDDGIGFIEAMGGGPVHWVGLSTGGFVGMRIALRRPDLLQSLTLMDTSAEGEPPLKRIKYEAMFAALRIVGMKPLIAPSMKIMFGREFMRDPARKAERDLWSKRLAANEPAAVIAFGRGIFGRDVILDRLSDIAAPTLVMVGEHDAATPPVCARRIHGAMPGSTLVVIPRAGHLSTIENPAAVNAALIAHLDAVAGAN